MGIKLDHPNLTPEQQNLLQELGLYFDRFCQQTGFLDRLQSENRWKPAFARLAVGEYMRFLFLFREVTHVVVPSPVIDAVWHLHLLYTEEYWGLCRTLLKKDLHHQPASGPGDEARYAGLFQATLYSYQSFFGNYPRSIWEGKGKPGKDFVGMLALISLLITVLIGSHHFLRERSGFSWPFIFSCWISFCFALEWLLRKRKQFLRRRQGQTNRRNENTGLDSSSGCSSFTDYSPGTYEGSSSGGHTSSHGGHDAGGHSGEGHGCGGHGCGGGGH